MNEFEFPLALLGCIFVLFACVFIADNETAQHIVAMGALVILVLLEIAFILYLVIAAIGRAHDVVAPISFILAFFFYLYWLAVWAHPVTGADAMEYAIYGGIFTFVGGLANFLIAGIIASPFLLVRWIAEKIRPPQKDNF